MDPVILVRTALDAGELLPLGERLSAAGLLAVDCPRPPLGSVQGDADEVAEQVRDLAHGPVHVLGASYSAAVALKLASHRTELVRSLTLVEPPPAGTAHDDDFRALCAQLVESRRRRGTAVALDDFMEMLAGAHWRARQESLRSGSVAQIEEGADAFFDADLPALLHWELLAEEVARIVCPVLVVRGSETGPGFAAMAHRLAEELPDARLAVVPGADHLAAATHPGEVAGLVARFVGRPG